MIVNDSKHHTYTITIVALPSEPKSFLIEVAGTPTVSSVLHYACGPRRNLGRLINELVREAEREAS